MKNFFIITFIIIIYIIFITYPKTTSNNNIKYYSYKLTDDSVYFLENNTLYKHNLKTNEKTKIETLKTNYTCTLKNDITCTNKNNTIIYDLKFKKKFESKNTLIPYKDTYLKVLNTNIYLTQNNKDILFQTLDSLFNDLIIVDYYKIDTTTFILFQNPTSKIYYLYNITAKEYQEINIENYNTYEQGFYFYNDLILKVYDLKNDIEKNYNSSEYNCSISALNESSDTLYFYKNHKLNIINLNTGLKKEEEVSQNINRIISIGNYLLLESAEEASLINLKNNTYNPETELNEKLTNITLNNDISIHIKEDAIIDYPDFYANVEANNLSILNALTKFEPIFAKFSKEVFSNFKNSNYNGLHLYLTGTLTPKDYETQVSNPAAYSLTLNNNYLIVIDINEPNLDKVLCHELMHNIEFSLLNNNKTPFLEWNNYNPSSFQYLDSYNKESQHNYTLTEKDQNNIYFIDEYSHTYPEEDRARIFENICANNNEITLKKYPKLYAKANYLKKELLNYYPTLIDNNLFNNF